MEINAIRNKLLNGIKSYSGILFILILGITLLPPYFRGLFFERDMFVHMIATGIMTLFVLIPIIGRRWQVQGWSSPIFWSWLMIILGYSIAMGNPANSREAFFGWLKILDYFLVFFAVKQILSRPEIKRMKGSEAAIGLLSVTGAGVAFLSLMVALGLVEYSGAVAGNRIFSTFQYPNTFAIYSGVVLLSLWHFTNEGRSPWITRISGALQVPVLMGILASGSRGGFLVFVIMAVIYLWGVGGRQGGRIAVVTGGAWGITVLAYMPILTTGSPQGIKGLVYLILAMVLAAGWVWGCQRFGHSLVKESTGIDRRKWLARSLVILLLSMNLWGSMQVTVIDNRMQTIISQDKSVNARIYFSQDALKIAMIKPLTGWGGDGWASVYRGYQSVRYDSTEVHNHFLQIWIEGGALALIGFVAIFLTALGSLWRRRKDCTPEGARAKLAGTGIVGLGIHGAMDFDFTYGAIYLLLALLAAILITNRKQNNEEIETELKKDPLDERNRRAIRMGTVVLAGFFAVGLIYFPYRFQQAAGWAKTADQLFQSNQGEEGLKALQEASRLDPRNGAYWLNRGMGEANLGFQKQDSNLVIQGLEDMEYARQASPYDPQVYKALWEMQYNLGLLDEALATVQQLPMLNPWDPASYEELARGQVLIGHKWLEKGEGYKANDLYQKAVLTQELVEGQLRKLTPELRRSWTKPPFLEQTPTMALYQEEAAILLGDWNRASQFAAMARQSKDPKDQGRQKLLDGVQAERHSSGSGQEGIEQAVQGNPQLVGLKKLLEKKVLLQ